MLNMHLISDFDDSFINKYHLGLGRWVWRIFKELGFTYMQNFFLQFNEVVYEMEKCRLDEMIAVSKDIIDGKIPQKQAEATFSYLALPNIFICRTDLQPGAIKLLYGDSVSTTFFCIDDFTHELLFGCNIHTEGGIPVDWFVVKQGDDVMQRRHMKLGYRLFEIPKRVKGNLQKKASYLIDIFRDIRNERMPQYSSAAYLVCLAWSSGLTNFFVEMSPFEDMTCLWRGLNAKRVYGLNDLWFIYHPWPTLIKTLSLLDSSSFSSKLTGLFTNHKLFLKALENFAYEWLMDHFPETFDVSFGPQIGVEGVPYPCDSLALEVPKNFKKNIDSDYWIYNKKRILFSDLKIPQEDALKGYYLDVDHETSLDEKIDETKIISVGIGRNTIFKKSLD